MIYTPAPSTAELLTNAMMASGSSNFLVDGFPRKLDQLEEFEATVS